MCDEAGLASSGLKLLALDSPCKTNGNIRRILGTMLQQATSLQLGGKDAKRPFPNLGIHAGSMLQPAIDPQGFDTWWGVTCQSLRSMQLEVGRVTNCVHRYKDREGTLILSSTASKSIRALWIISGANKLHALFPPCSCSNGFWNRKRLGHAAFGHQLHLVLDSGVFGWMGVEQELRCGSGHRWRWRRYVTVDIYPLFDLAFILFVMCVFEWVHWLGWLSSKR